MPLRKREGGKIGAEFFSNPSSHNKSEYSPFAVSTKVSRVIDNVLKKRKIRVLRNFLRFCIFSFCIDQVIKQYERNFFMKNKKLIVGLSLGLALLISIFTVAYFMSKDETKKGEKNI